MKYIPLSDIDVVDNALNFNTADCYLIGGCDVFTTKKVRSEKALCQKIEDDLKTQNENARFYSPGGTERATVPRPSPFGDLNDSGPRQAFAYMLLTLNATHEFHEFRHVLTPNDFTECSLRSAQQDVDRALANLQPARHTYVADTHVAHLGPTNAIAARPIGGCGVEPWRSFRNWGLIDKHIDFKHCQIFRYEPSTDPLADEDQGASLWYMHYFFYNKVLKRVCYLHLRALSIISHSPLHAASYLRSEPTQRKASSISTIGGGAGKRAGYWISDDRDIVETGSYSDNDDDEMVDEEDEYDVPDMDLDDVRNSLADGTYGAYYYDDDDY